MPLPFAGALGREYGVVACHGEVPYDALPFRSEVEDSACAGGAASPYEGPFVLVREEALASCEASYVVVEDMDADGRLVVVDSSKRRIQPVVQVVVVEEEDLVDLHALQAQEEGQVVDLAVQKDDCSWWVRWTPFRCQLVLFFGFTKGKLTDWKGRNGIQEGK